MGKQDKLFHEASAVRRAIMGLPGARARWDLRRKYGMSDAQLRKAIQDEMDCFGDVRTFYMRVKWQSLPDPTITYTCGDSEPVTVSGKDLVRLVRKVIRIRRPIEMQLEESQ